MSKSDKKKFCQGCRNNFYNGNNDLGVAECWNLSAAKLVSRKRVSLWQSPPWLQEPEKVLSCRDESGYVFVDPKRKN